MDNKTKLSHSAVSRYIKCPQSYKYHYVDKLRPNATSSALLFGSALDAAVEAVLEDHNADYITVFNENWKEAFINKSKEALALNTKIAYAERDMDWDLLTPDDIAALQDFISMHQLTYIAGGAAQSTYKECVTFKKQQAHRKFKNKEHQYLNFANWLCMARKAPLMIEAFKKEILPRITEVHSTQKHIKLENEAGDITQGYIDMVVTLDDGKRYVLDLKTSARKYAEDAANYSPQLSLYAYHEGVEDIGYVVLYKNIANIKNRVCSVCNTKELNNRVKSCSNEVSGKRCGSSLLETNERKAELDLILGKTNERYSEAVIENFDVVNELVKKKVFYKNFDSCENWFGQQCPYFNVCFKGCSKGLVDESL